VESVAALPWNGRQFSRGISGRIRVESVAAFAWNTHAEGLGQTDESARGGVSRLGSDSSEGDFGKRRLAVGVGYVREHGDAGGNQKNQIE
jgi:hypothetical protein